MDEKLKIKEKIDIDIVKNVETLNKYKNELKNKIKSAKRQKTLKTVGKN